MGSSIVSIKRRIGAAARRTRLLMIDSCTITRSTGIGAFNTATLAHDATTPPTAIYDGDCLVQVRNRAEHTADIGDEDVTVHLYDVYLPATATGIKIDDLVVIDDSSDDDLVGVTMRVRDVAAQSMLPARQLTCEYKLG